MFEVHCPKCKNAVPLIWEPCPHCGHKAPFIEALIALARVVLRVFAYLVSLGIGAIIGKAVLGYLRDWWDTW